MARAKAGTGFILVVGLFAGAAPAAAPGSDETPRVAQLFGSKPSRALGDAIEAQRHGDYEHAAALLQDAAAGQGFLTPTEQQELARLMKDNVVALDGRRAAAEQLRLAQNALKDNRQTDAIDLLKRVAANEQYLTTADRQAFRKCSTGLNLPGAGGPPEPPVVALPPAALPPAAATNGAQRGSWSSRPAFISSRGTSIRPRRRPRTPPPSRWRSPGTRIRRPGFWKTCRGRALTPRPYSRRPAPRSSGRTLTRPNCTPISPRRRVPPGR